MVIIVSKKEVNTLGGELPGAVLVDENKIYQRILFHLERGDPVVALYPGAWSEYPKIEDTLKSRGLNHYLYTPIDPTELELAKEKIDPKILILAKHAGALASMSNKAITRLEPSKPVDRRSLLRLRLEKLSLYTPAPILLNEDACASWKNCHLCIEACPFEAIRTKPPTVNLNACTGCGVCTSACPFGLLIMPKHNVQALEYVLDAIRSRYQGPAVIIGTCTSMLPKLANALGGISPQVLPVIIPVECPGWISQYHMVLAASNGFDTILACDTERLSKCGGRNIVESWLAELSPVGAYPDILESPEDLAKVLSTYKSISKPIELEGSIVKNKLLIYEALRRLKTPRLRLSSPLVGNAIVDEEKCLLCDACSNMCPYRALKLDMRENRVRLLFRGDKCMACKLCEQVCPYGALRLEYSYDLETAHEWTSVAEDEVARCRRCGRPIGSMKHLLMIEEKLRQSGANEWVLQQIWLCDKCKIESLLSGRSE